MLLRPQRRGVRPFMQKVLRDGAEGGQMLELLVHKAATVGEACRARLESSGTKSLNRHDDKATKSF